MMFFPLPPSWGKVDRAKGARRMRGRCSESPGNSTCCAAPSSGAFRATFSREGGRAEMNFYLFNPLVKSATSLSPIIRARTSSASFGYFSMSTIEALGSGR